MAKFNIGDGKRPLANPPSSISDLNMVQHGDQLTTSLSQNARWAGIEKFATRNTNDKSTPLTNKLYKDFGTAPSSLSAEAKGKGFYRGWTTDTDGAVHVSNIVEVK